MLPFEFCIRPTRDSKTLKTNGGGVFVMQHEIHFQSNGTSEYLLKRLSLAWIELSTVTLACTLQRGNRRLNSILVQQIQRQPHHAISSDSDTET